MLGEPSTYGKPRLRIEMFAQARIAGIEPALAVLNAAKAILGFAEAAGYEECVAGLRAGAEGGAAATAFSDDGRINKDVVAASGVATRSRTVQFSRSSAQAAQEFVKPLPL